MYQWRESVEAGGLISYGPSLTLTLRGRSGPMSAGFSRAPSLPICQYSEPTRFELVINLKTAKTLGLIVPQSILTLADEVIE